MTHAEDKGRMKHIMTFLNGMAVHEQVWPVFWGKKILCNCEFGEGRLV
jgi:hypothetical protein